METSTQTTKQQITVYDVRPGRYRAILPLKGYFRKDLRPDDQVSVGLAGHTLAVVGGVVVIRLHAVELGERIFEGGNVAQLLPVK